MAFRDITVFIRANVADLKRGLAQSAGEIRRFNASIGGTAAQMGTFTKRSQNASHAVNNFNRSAGLAAAGVSRHTKALSAGGAIFEATAHSAGLASKALAGFKTIAIQVGAALTGFLAVNAGIQAIMGSVRAVVSSWRDFDQAMTNSLAIMGDLSDAMKNDMTDAAREMAKQSTFAAHEVAEAYFFLASAGLDANAALQVLDESVRFAQAGNFDLATATDLLTDSMSAIGLVTRDAAGNIVMNMEDAAGGVRTFEDEYTRVSDVLVKANQVSNATVQQFSQALTTKAAPAARQLGLSIEETTAVLAVFADQGIKGQRAGTQFSMVLRDLTTKAIKNADEFENLGIRVFDAQGEFRGFPNIISDMENAFAGMSDKQLRSSLQMLGFTDRSVAATSALLGTSNQLRAYQKATEDAGGATEEVYKKQLESFNAKLTLLKNNLLDVAIGAGQKFNEWLNKIGESQDFQNIVKGVRALFDALTPVIGVVGKFVGLLTGSALTVFGKALGGVGKVLDEFSVVAEVLVAMLGVRLVSSLLSSANAFQANSQAVSRAKGSFKTFGDQLSTMRKNIGNQPTILGKVGAGYRGFGKTVKSTAASFKTSMKAMGAAANSIASIAVPAIIINSLLTLGSVAKESKEEYKALLEEMKPESGVFESYSQLNDYTDRLRGNLRNLREELQQEEDLGGSAEAAGNAFIRGIQNFGEFVNVYEKESSKLEGKIQAVEEALDQASASSRNYQLNILALANITGASSDVIEATANQLGIDLSGSITSLILDFPRLADSIKANESALATLGITAEEAGEMTSEELQEAAKEADESSQEFVEALTAMIDSTKAYEDALFDLPTGQDAFDIALEQNEKSLEDRIERQKEAAKASVDALKAQREAELDARGDMLDDLENQRDAELDVREDMLDNIATHFEDGTELTDEHKKLRKQEIEDEKDLLNDQYDAQKDAYQEQTELLEKSWDDKIAAAESGASDLSDSLEELSATMPGWAQILSTLGSEQEAAESFSSQLDTILRIGLQEFANNPDMERAVIDSVSFLRELGPEQGGPLATEILGNVTGFIEDYNVELGRLGEASTFSFEQYLANLRDQTLDFLDVQKNLFTLADNFDKVTGANMDQLRQLAVDEPETLAYLAEQIDQGNIAAFQTFIDQQTQIQGAQLGAEMTEMQIELRRAIIEGRSEDVERLLAENEEDLLTIISSWTPEMTQEFYALAGTYMEDFETDAKMRLERLLLMIRQINENDGRLGPDHLQPGSGYRYNPGPRRPEPAPGMADGGILRVRHFAAGGMERHQAKIHRSQRVFAEPETGGEAYIPLARSKRMRSLGLLEQVAGMFGMAMQPQGFADGGTMGAQMGGVPGVKVVTVEVPQKSETNYNFGDISASDPAATIAYARRKARRNNLNSMNGRM